MILRPPFNLIAIFLGAVFGGLVGTFFPVFSLRLEFMGIMFLDALKMMVLPLIISSLVVGVTNLGTSTLGKIGLRTFLYYMVTTGLAVLIGILVVTGLKPGVGFEVPLTEAPVITHSYSFKEVLMGLIHPNLFEAAVEFKILPLIMASIFFGIALRSLKGREAPVVQIFTIVNDAVMKIIHVIILFTPLGVFGLIAHRLGAAGGGTEVLNLLLQLSRYFGAVILGLAIHGLVVLPLLLFLFARRSVWRYFQQMVQALMTAFATASSSATLPLTMSLTEDAGVPRRISGFVLPLGATVNMDGTALYEAVAAIFIAQVYGIDLSLGQQGVIFITATLAAIGAAGIPEAGLVTMVLVLQSVGLPIEGIGMLLAIDWILDRFRTTVNVWGDSVGAAIIHHYDEKGTA